MEAAKVPPGATAARASHVSIVTGAGRGVGRATVVELARAHGRRVIAVGRDAEALAAVAEEAGTLVEPLRLDITGPEAAAILREAVGDRAVEALVHNAGRLLHRSLGAYDLRSMEELFVINVHAPLLLTQALADKLAGSPGGHVVVISSMGGFQDSVKFPGLAAYSASKAAAACLAQCLAAELGGRGVRCNALALGAVDTDMLRAAFPGYQAPVDAETMGRYVARFALEGADLFNAKVLPVAVSTP